MTLSFYIECDDCGKEYRIRYGLGNNYPQLATFQCHECVKQIEIGYKKYLEGATINGATQIRKENSRDENVTVQNLHPEIPTAHDNRNDPYHFSTMDMFNEVEKSNINFREFQSLQHDIVIFYDKWSDIEKKLRIVSHKGGTLLKQICGITFSEFVGEFDKWAENFISGNLENDFDNFCYEYNSVDLIDIKAYLKADNKALKQINELCCIYMKNAEQFQGTILNQKSNIEIKKEMTVNANWDKISSVYGDLYEIVGDLFVFPTMINNIKSGRNFDQFETPNFTLAKYLETDKASRTKNFHKNENLKFLSKPYHSWLRNGTHHKNSYLDTETFIINLGVGKGGTNSRTISLTEYIENCNNIFSSGLILARLILHARQ